MDEGCDMRSRDQETERSGRTASRNIPKNGTKKTLLIALTASVFTVALLGGWQALADVWSEPGGVPRLVPYRGHLELDGVPVDGALSLAVSIYDAEAGGELLWGPETNLTTAVNGDFSLMLGQSLPIDPEILSEGDAWIGFSVDGTDLTGRQRLGSAPYAMRALEAVNALNGVPSGTIVPYGGAVPPPGWLLCDGAAVSSTDYPELSEALGTAWGEGTSDEDDATDFNLPDLRGRFLRGVDGGSGRDPEASTRASILPGGNEGDLVGSFQEDATAIPNAGFSTSDYSHSHTTTIGESNNNDGDSNCIDTGPYCTGGARSWPTNTNTHSHVIEGGDPETRPENVYVSFIIRY